MRITVKQHMAKEAETDLPRRCLLGLRGALSRGSHPRVCANRKILVIRESYKDERDERYTVSVAAYTALLTHRVYASYLNRENEFFVALVRLITLRLSRRRLSKESYEICLKAFTNLSNYEEK